MSKKKEPTKRPDGGFTRRGFLGSVGAGAMAAATGASLTRWTLLFVLRERLGFTGTKVSCERGECGSCTVLMDGVPRYACMTLAVEAEGSEITTVEGLLDGEELGNVQKAFVEEDAFQCGYCTSGQIMAAEGLLRANPSPTLHQIQTGMSGNLCRCAAYVNIFKAVDRAADEKKKGGRS
jgi:xanthine dehydrogenase YagT iron-sulfur-binding subunit